MTNHHSVYHCTKIQRKPSSPSTLNPGPRVIPRSEQPLAVKQLRQRDYAENGYKRTTTSLGFTSPDRSYTSTNRMTFLSPEPDSSSPLPKRHISPHPSPTRAPQSIKTSWNPTESLVQLGTDRPALDSSTSAYSGFDPGVYRERAIDHLANRRFGRRTNVVLGDGISAPDGSPIRRFETQLQQNTNWVHRDLGRAQEMLREDRYLANHHKAFNMNSSIEIVSADQPKDMRSTAQQVYSNPWRRNPDTMPLRREGPDFRRVAPFKTGEAKDVKTILNESDSSKYRLASNAHSTYTGFVFG